MLKDVIYYRLYVTPNIKPFFDFEYKSVGIDNNIPYLDFSMPYYTINPLLLDAIFVEIRNDTHIFNMFSEKSYITKKDFIGMIQQNKMEIKKLSIQILFDKYQKDLVKIDNIV